MKNLKHILLLVFLFFNVVISFAQKPNTENNNDGNDPVLAKLYSPSGPYAKFNPSKEDVTKRTESSKHFLNEDGSTISVFASGPCHYKENGVWKTSSNEITQNSNPQFPFVNLHNEVKTLYGNLLQGIKFKWQNGSEVTGFTPVSIFAANEAGNKVSELFQIQNSTPSTVSNRVSYKQVVPSMDYSIEQLAGKIRSTYTIEGNVFQNAPAGTENIVITEKINLPIGCKVVKEKDERSGKQVLKVSLNNELLFTYSDVYYWDDSLNKMQLFHQPAEFDFALNNQIMEVNIKIPFAWLNNPNTKYPVTIDPTVNVTPDNSTWWTGTMENSGGGYNDILGIGFYDCSGCTDIDYRGWVKFNLSSLPDYACVTSAELNMYQNWWNDGNGDNGCQWDIGWANVDPPPSSWSTIYNALSGLSERYVRWDVWGTPGACGGCSGGYDYPESPNGWKSFNLSGNTAIRSRLKQTTTQDYITIGLDLTYHASDCFWCWNDESNFIRWDGYSSGNRPYIAVTHNDAASSTTWTGAISTDWFNNGNWTNCVPAANTVVTIPNASNKPLINSGTGNCYTITIEDGAVVTINSDNGAVLNVTQP